MSGFTVNDGLKSTQDYTRIMRACDLPVAVAGFLPRTEVPRSETSWTFFHHDARRRSGYHRGSNPGDTEMVS